MSEPDRDPVRWAETPERAPPGALELVRSIERTPPLPPDLSRVVLPRARPPAWRRWVGPSLAAAVIVGGLVLWRFAPREEDVVVTVTPLEEPAAVSPALASAESAGEAAPADEAAEQVARATPAGPSASAEPAGGFPRPRREQPAPSAARGRLTVTSIPWARVFLDGRDIGQNTPVVNLPLAPGSHGLELRSGSGATFRQTIVIRAGESLRVVHRFEGRSGAAGDPPAVELAQTGYGTLMIQTIPWARVFVDGRDTGQSTPVRNLRVPAGRHEIGLRTADGVMHTVQVDVAADETTRIVRQLEPSHGMIDEDE
ncbi:MAG: PEGA domain-containing protein [Sandaracinaceae bacterium]|nr:PEGA domain-containing protein [Sandaracinaceae bacterium]